MQRQLLAASPLAGRGSLQFGRTQACRLLDTWRRLAERDSPDAAISILAPAASGLGCDGSSVHRRKLDDEFTQAVEHLTSWRDVLDVRRRYRNCGWLGGWHAEDCADRVAHFVAEHLDQLDELGKFAPVEEVELESAIADSISGVDDFGDLARIEESFQRACPAGREKLCKVVLSRIAIATGDE